MGLFALVLHTHLPYVRRNGVWPSGEDFFHQAAVESYLPLLEVLERLADRGIRDALTIGITPLVANQMDDPYMLRELTLYLGRYELRALQQVANYDREHAAAFKDLAAFYALHARRQLARLEALVAGGGGIAQGFAALRRAGLIEILGGPASHPYLPLVREPALVEAQVALGAAEHRRIFGEDPRGVWLPECAYRPDTEPRIEDVLARNGISHFVVDGPTMIRAAGDAATFRPRLVGDSTVAAFARNLDVTYRVWSPTGGYPSDKWYRDFFHYDLEAGFKNWRVTDRRAHVGLKQPYDPERGRERAMRHAEDFVALVAETLDAFEREHGEEGVVVSCYDTELFGHWWFEGPLWLERVIELLAAHPRVRPVSLQAALEAMPPREAVALGEGSWGFRKDHRSWVAPETEPMWKALGEVEAETARLVRAGARSPSHRAALDQLVREAMLLQTSDWPFMVLRGRNPGYAQERFDGHLARWRRMAEALEQPADESERAARDLFEVDNAFPALDAAALLGARATAAGA